MESVRTLWIAFIFQYLWDTTQREFCRLKNSLCCELLSFFSIFGIQHNLRLLELLIRRVVNCFHFSVSLGYNTTAWKTAQPKAVLWIAFIFQYLWDTTQQMALPDKNYNSCELLSFFSIFGIQHNQKEILLLMSLVVNCFHFSVSLGYNTTKHSTIRLLHGLWIAFIFQYLWDTTQRIERFRTCNQCCELLSFFSIFGIQHNKLKQKQ